MTKEAYLSQVGILSRRVLYHTERLHRLRLEADAVRSRWGEQSFSRAGDAPYARMLENIETAKEELNAENELLSRLQRQVEETINMLPEEKARLFLLYRYIEEKTLSEIEELLFLSMSSVKRLRLRAMDGLVLPEDAISIFPKTDPA